MNASDISTILGAAGGFILVLGGGAKYLLSRMDAKTEAAAKLEKEARTELYERLQTEISFLRQELREAEGKSQLYLRRIFQLESFIHRQPGIDIPLMDGWPPA